MTTEDIEDIKVILDDEDVIDFVELKKSKRYVVGEVDQKALEDDWEDKIQDETKMCRNISKRKCDRCN